MAHRNVQLVIGRLVTDEGFRLAFAADPKRTLSALAASGLPLTPTEQDALAATDPATWDRVAATLDPRLQQVALTPDEWAR